MENSYSIFRTGLASRVLLLLNSSENPLSISDLNNEVKCSDLKKFMDELAVEGLVIKIDSKRQEAYYVITFKGRLKSVRTIYASYREG